MAPKKGKSAKNKKKTLLNSPVIPPNIILDPNIEEIPSEEKARPSFLQKEINKTEMLPNRVEKPLVIPANIILHPNISEDKAQPSFVQIEINKLSEQPSVIPQNIILDPENPAEEKAFVQIDINNNLQNYLFENELKPKMQKAEKAHSEPIDFTKDLIKIEKELVTINPLPKSRFGTDEDSTLMIAPTELHKKIDDFMENKVYNQLFKDQKLWITGSSGIGKTFAILKNVIKKRRSNSKNLILLHMILNERYLDKFPEFFFNDLLYAFFPFINDKSFPPCPDFKEKTESPLKDWLIYILMELKIKNNQSFYKFLFAVSSYCDISKLQFIIIIDQTNIFQRRKKFNKLGKFVDEFLSELINGSFSDKVVISSSNNNEDLDTELSAVEREDCILEAHLEGCFSKEQMKQILINKFALNYDDEQIDELIEETGSIPLEVWEFGKIEKDDFDEKLKEYLVERSIAIEKEIGIFYHKKVQNIEWEETFLEIFFILLDTNQNIQDPNHLNFIDRKYMFVKNKKLFSVSPLAKQVLFHYYTKRLLAYEERLNSNLTSNYKDLYKKTDEKNEASLKGFLLEKLLINQLFRKKNEEMSLICYKNRDQKINISMKFSEILFFKEGIDHNDFYHDTLFVPRKFNNPFADLYYYDKTKKCLYLFQITLSIVTHKNSDVLFKIHQQCENLLSKKETIAKVIFVWVTDSIDVQELKATQNQFINPTEFIKAEKIKLENKKSKKIEALNDKPKKKSVTPKDIDSIIMSARENTLVWKFD